MVNTIHSDSLRSLRTDEFLPPISRWTSLGGMVLVGAIGLAVGISAVIKYNVAVKAGATVRPMGELRVVQAELEGTVKQIEVKENQTVKAGDVIAYLDDSKLQMQSNQLHDTMQQNQFQLAQLDAQVRLLDSQILAEVHSNDRSLAAAQAEITRNQRDYVEKQLTSEADVEEAQVALETAEADRQRYQALADAGAVSQQQFQEKQAAFRMAQARLERAQATLNPSNAVVEIATEQLGQQQARGEVTLATLNREREALIQRRSEIQSQLIRDQTELAQVEEELEKSTIRATTDGTIFQLSLLNPNQVIRMGDNVAQIAPVDASLVVKARVANQDIDRVELGQMTQLRVDACPYTDYGTLKGTVTEIAPDISTAQNNVSVSKTSNTTEDRSYEVTIAIDRTTLVNGQHQCQIQPGMEATASIISREETVLQFVLRKLRLFTDL